MRMRIIYCKRGCRSGENFNSLCEYVRKYRSIADLIKVSLDAFDHEVVLQEMEGMDAEELLAYDGIILGSYTWGDEGIAI